jgi:hypothetical protein
MDKLTQCPHQPVISSLQLACNHNSPTEVDRTSPFHEDCYCRQRMVKPLSFKGEKKPKKRKRTDAEGPNPESGSRDLAVAGADEDPENDDSWVTADTLAEIVGPVMFVLPTQPAMCLACDANGKIFTDTIVNIIDANPASAEPHDVRQVWVANKIAGTENFRFKARHGKYGQSRASWGVRMQADRVFQISQLRPIRHSQCNK